MNLNTGFFAPYNHRRKQPNVGYRLSVNSQQYHQTLCLKSGRSSSIESTNSTESFLPSIHTNNVNNDGYRPYRRNDFANNHVFIAKQKLAKIFLDQPTTNIPLRSDLIHLFDQYEPKQKYRRINKNKRQDNNSVLKSARSVDQDAHLSVVNLIMKPSLPSSPIRDSLTVISHRRTHAIPYQTNTPRPSVEWINPAINQHIRSISNHTSYDDPEPNTIINELIDKNLDFVNNINNPLNSSLSYVKSMIPPIVLQHR